MQQAFRLLMHKLSESGADYTDYHHRYTGGFYATGKIIQTYCGRSYIDFIREFLRSGECDDGLGADTGSRGYIHANKPENATFPAPPGSSRIRWDGTDKNGRVAGNGTYLAILRIYTGTDGLPEVGYPPGRILIGVRR